MTETRQDPDLRHIGADVQSITDALLAHAASSGGTLTSAEVGRRLDEAAVTPAQAKKLVRALAEAGVLVFEATPQARSKGGAGRGAATRVVAARAATAASRVTTVKAEGEGDVDLDSADAKAVRPVAKPAVKLTAVEPQPEGAAAESTAGAVDGAAGGAAAAAKAAKAPAKKAPARKAGAKKPTTADAPAAGDAPAPAKVAKKAAPAKVAKPGEATGVPGAPAVAGEEAELEEVELDEALAAELEEVVVEEPAALVEAAQADAETDSNDFEWDDEESEALKQARRDAELTASADSVRAYLKQIGKVPLLNA
ncbi:MAG: hypothetical protein QOE61_4758, partial [Micromonosporaceae bacterium]|nr:hypothetical protein [Micromonosporaceae bacterium]